MRFQAFKPKFFYFPLAVYKGTLWSNCWLLFSFAFIFFFSRTSQLLFFLFDFSVWSTDLQSFSILCSVIPEDKQWKFLSSDDVDHLTVILSTAFTLQEDSPISRKHILYLSLRCINCMNVVDRQSPPHLNEIWKIPLRWLQAQVCSIYISSSIFHIFVVFMVHWWLWLAVGGNRILFSHLRTYSSRNDFFSRRETNSQYALMN